MHLVMVRSDKESFNFENALYLGKWCLTALQALQSKRLNIVEYHWDDRGKLSNDYIYLNNIYEDLLSRLVDALNLVHGVNHSNRYWRIVIGPWLSYFIHITYDRWYSIQNCFTKHKPDFVCIVNETYLNYIPNDMNDFIGMYSEDWWNEYIFSEVIRNSSVNIKKIIREPIEKIEGSTLKPTRQFRKSITGAILKISGIFGRNNNIFFIETYLSKINLFLLQLSLFQFPSVFRSTACPLFITEPEKRGRVKKLLKESGDYSYENFLREMVSALIPRVYLEGYSSMVSMSEKLPWPKAPKLIFTSNSYSADEFFKIWTARKIENGVGLMIGQHGGAFGVSKFISIEDHQVRVADKFITWGWQDERKNVIPYGNIKLAGKKKIKHAADGGLLLIELSLPRYSYHLYSAPISGQWLNYLEDQLTFVNSLPNNIRDDLTIRLFPDDYGWKTEELWREKFPNVDINSEHGGLERLFKKTRLQVCTYNATTYLESLKLNMPTIIFWDPMYWEIREDSTPYFEKLAEVGIFHKSPESAALHVAKIWGAVECWWDSYEVQNARNQFCREYSYEPLNPISDLNKIVQAV